MGYLWFLVCHGSEVGRRITQEEVGRVWNRHPLRWHSHRTAHLSAPPHARECARMHIYIQEAVTNTMAMSEYLCVGEELA